MVMPTTNQVAEIIWAECGAMRESATVVTPTETYQHRLAVGICVVNRGRQNLPWGRGSGQTAVPRGPTADELAVPAASQGWGETNKAAAAAMLTRTLRLDDPNTLYGAQPYFHTWRGPCGHHRLGGEFVTRIPSWDTRRRRIDGNGREWIGPRLFWLCVHVIVVIRDRHIIELEPGCMVPTRLRGNRFSMRQRRVEMGRWRVPNERA